MKVALVTRSMAATNALVRRLEERGWLSLVIVEGFAAPKERSLLDRVKRRVERLAPGAWDARAAGARELAAIARVYGELAAPLRRLPPLLEVPHKRWEAATRALTELAPDVVVTFGSSIVPPDLCATPKIAALNLHAGDAPRYRGMYCVEQALLAGDIGAVAGTLHRLTPKIDGGDIVAHTRPTIDARDDEETLVHRVHDANQRLLIEALGRLERGGALRPVAQPGDGRLYLASAWTDEARARLRGAIEGGLLARPAPELPALVAVDAAIADPA